MQKYCRSILFGFFLCFFSQVGWAELKILATIKPIYSLVKNVSGSKNQVMLLLDQNSSPHHYQVKPSDVRKILAADIIFFIDDEFELFLTDYLKQKQVKAKLVKLSAADGLNLLPTKGHEEHEHHHHHGEYDMHFWSDPNNAKVIVNEVAKVLAAEDSSNKDYYLNNAKQTDLRLEDLDKEIEVMVSKIHDKHYVVLHDGYQYFEKRYKLSNVGAVSVDKNMIYGAKTIKDLKNKIVEQNVKCIFAEPQFSAELVKKVAQLTGVKYGYLDIEWGEFSEGNIKDEDTYFVMMKQNAKNMVGCLS